MTAPAVAVRSLSKNYQLYSRPQDRLKQTLFRRFGRNYAREFAALTDIDFSVSRGEAFGIIGQNGSGKSTLLQILAGTLQPSAGRVEIDGRISALLELGAGFNPEFTGRENAAMNAAILGVPRAAVRDLLPRIEAFAQIGDFIDQPVKTYSSGMYVRLAFAVAVSVDPDILIVDEALAVGDALFQSRCFRRMEHIRNSGKTIILVSHDYYLVQSFCDRALLLDQGRMVEIGPAKKVVHRYIQQITTREKDFVESMEGNPAAAGSETSTHPSPGKPEEYRFGSREAEITDCRLEDGKGAPASVWRTGQEGRIVVDVFFRRRVDNPVIGFSIATPTGVNVCGTNSWYADRFPGACEAGEILRTVFRQKIPLHAGTYVLNASVADKGETMEQLDFRMDVLSFRVMGDALHSGLVDMDSEILYERKIHEE